jgi:histidyl-tRNA synthetase
MNQKKISNLPPRGTADWFPDEMQIRQSIFNTWREVCRKFGYREYLTPILENADIYRAKSGEDVGGSELLTIQKEDGELAIRPEMTPSVTRMVTRIYNGAPKPIKLFSVANFYRYQKPQRGRNREFWQLNYDIFGAKSLNADTEIIQIGLEIMLSFKPPAGSFTVYVNNRKLINEILELVVPDNETAQKSVARVMDKWDKLSEQEFRQRLLDIGLSEQSTEKVRLFMISENSEQLKSNLPEMVSTEGLSEVEQVIESLGQLGFSDWVKFQPNIIRGFDYYDGIVFEVFDNHPDNSRALFGGGRYNGLAGIFGSETFPASGAAPGDEAIRLFLESWNLLDNLKNSSGNTSYYIPLLSDSTYPVVQKIAKQLREAGGLVEIGFEVQTLKKALEYANKRATEFVVILDERQLSDNVYRLKNMRSGSEELVELTQSA